MINRIKEVNSSKKNFGTLSVSHSATIEKVKTELLSPELKPSLNKFNYRIPDISV